MVPRGLSGYLCALLDGFGGALELFGRSEALLGCSWSLLGRSWALFGCSWSLLGRSWGPLGALLATSSGLLGRSWGALEAFLGLRGGPELRLVKKTEHFGLPEGPQIRPTSPFKPSFGRFFGVSIFDSIFDAFLHRLWLPKWSKMEPKSNKKCDFFVDRRWKRFLHVSSRFLSSFLHQPLDPRTLISKRPYGTF